MPGPGVKQGKFTSGMESRKSAQIFPYRMKEVLPIKQQSHYRHVLKLTTDQLEAAGWDLRIDLHEAKKDGCVISLAESTCIRMIENIAGVDSAVVGRRLREIGREIRELRRQPKSREQIREIRSLYQQQNELQYMPEYLCVVSATQSAFRRACKGFKVNGVRYGRLVGTTGGVKNSTVVFAAETARNGAPLLEELRRRINNGRDMTKEFVPAKLEAYRALVCSASVPLSAPRGVLVVDDCVTHFKSSYILLGDGETDEPVMSTVVDGDVELIDSDGYGLMSPELARRWGYDLRLDYRPAGICLRNSFCKGMVFAFDFHEFSESVAGRYEVTDIWGQVHDIRSIDLVLTASMLKLWDSYGSIGEYLENCRQNGYCFSATKATPKELDVERRLNYQFIQSYHLTDEQIWELVEPTLTEFDEITGGNYEKTLLFLRGTHITEETAWSPEMKWIAALMIEPKMLEDPFVTSQLNTLVKAKMTEAKFGKIKVSGNFSVISGDPYALCENIWGISPKGLLKANEIYNRYWDEAGAQSLAAFRAPMSSHHNIRRLSVQRGWNARHWYQYMDTVTVLNAWDMTTHALNGADKDGDLIFLTDNKVLVENVRDVLPIQCGQKKAAKKIPTEHDFMVANLKGFGDEIGSVTNRITAQTELQSMFPPDSEEYKRLSYRIISGQKIQQDVIDSLKGIVAKPMPKHWYNEKAAATTGDPVDARICASKKPYFMVWRYPELGSRFRTFEKNVHRNSLMTFGVGISELMSSDDLSEEQKGFLSEYYRLCPVQPSNGVINRICRLCEKHFATKKEKSLESKFDVSLLKTGVSYSRYAKDKIKVLYREYMDCRQQLRINAVSDEDFVMKKHLLAHEYQGLCAAVCPNEDELCDVVLDVCYTNERAKHFAWEMCGEKFLENLLNRHDGMITYIQAAKNGGIHYGGRTFIKKQLCVKGDTDEGYYIERSQESGRPNKLWRYFG